MSTTTRFFRSCWCGNAQLEPFSEHYRACRNCETLVSMFDHGKDVSRVADDDADLYGRDYWFGHMEQDLGFANIYERARVDLTERCLFWLETLLRFQRPPARVLELGSAHGGFVALMRWAGFEAHGLELSPEIVALAKQLFGVPMWQGPIEDQPIPAESLDLIAAMDVLEHLPDPVATLRHCVSRLAPGGQLLLQTPQYREGATLEQLQAEGHRFVEHAPGARTSLPVQRDLDEATRGGRRRAEPHVRASGVQPLRHVRRHERGSDRAASGRSADALDHDGWRTARPGIARSVSGQHRVEGRKRGTRRRRRLPQAHRRRATFSRKRRRGAAERGNRGPDGAARTCRKRSR